MDREFWKAALIRAAHTWVHAFVAAIPSSAAVLSDVNWKLVVSAATLAAVISLAKSVVVGLPEVNQQRTLDILANDPDDFDDEEDDEFEDPDNLEEGDE